MLQSSADHRLVVGPETGLLDTRSGRTMPAVELTSREVLEKIAAGPAQKVKVAITDIDGVLRGKYIHRDKFLSAVEGGFGFCNVVFGWDSSDTCYDNVGYTGWHSGYPDALARLDLRT